MGDGLFRKDGWDVSWVGAKCCYEVTIYRVTYC